MFLVGEIKRPATRHYVLVGLFLLVSVALLAVPMIPELLGSGKNKDYPLWYFVGQRVLAGGPIYVIEPDGRLDFLYTPFAALLLAIPSYFGKPALVAMLACTTLASWWADIRLSNRLAGSEKSAPWSVVLPVMLTLPFVYDHFHLGQPNLLLLALMLTGFVLLRVGRPWLAGLPFATAAAIKVFPVLIIPYLLWRRQWRTLASMAAIMLLFLVVLPSTIRGFERTVGELNTWVHAMLLSADDLEFAQRPDSFGWKNQSLYAVEQRLLRPVDAEIASDEPSQSVFVNLLNLDRRTADMVFVATAIAIGLSFIAVLPKSNRRTFDSDAAEWAIVLLLIVIGSPVARSYYFVWLLFPYTILLRWLTTEPDRRLATAIAAAIGCSALLLAIGVNAIQPRYPQAAGNFLWATLIVIVALAVRMRRAALPA